eukprot:Gb_37953 [translate_table: standard]
MKFRGHLLVLETLHPLHLNHALMEIGYCDHQIASSLSDDPSVEIVHSSFDTLSVSMTATVDSKGHLVLGMSLLSVAAKSFGKGDTRCFEILCWIVLYTSRSDTYLHYQTLSSGFLHMALTVCHGYPTPFGLNANSSGAREHLQIQFLRGTNS